MASGEQAGENVMDEERAGEGDENVPEEVCSHSRSFIRDGLVRSRMVRLPSLDQFCSLNPQHVSNHWLPRETLPIIGICGPQGATCALL